MSDHMEVRRNWKGGWSKLSFIASVQSIRSERAKAQTKRTLLTRIFESQAHGVQAYPTLEYTQGPTLEEVVCDGSAQANVYAKVK